MISPRFSSLRLDYDAGAVTVRLNAAPPSDLMNNAKATSQLLQGLHRRSAVPGVQLPPPPGPGDVFLIDQRLRVSEPVRQAVLQAEKALQEEKVLSKPQLGALLQQILPDIQANIGSIVASYQNRPPLPVSGLSNPLAGLENAAPSFQRLAALLQANSHEITIQSFPGVPHIDATLPAESSHS
jgi:hypothetical protein